MLSRAWAYSIHSVNYSGQLMKYVNNLFLGHNGLSQKLPPGQGDMLKKHNPTLKISG
jgi:hypothetical protein